MGQGKGVGIYHSAVRIGSGTLVIKLREAEHEGFPSHYLAEPRLPPFLIIIGWLGGERRGWSGRVKLAVFLLQAAHPPTHQRQRLARNVIMIGGNHSKFQVADLRCINEPTHEIGST